MTEGPCCSCGGACGQPETNFDPTADPRAWHPCYHCLETGKCDHSVRYISREAEARAMHPAGRGRA